MGYTKNKKRKKCDTNEESQNFQIYEFINYL